MTQKQETFCFCTLAYGSTYRALARELAKDLEKYSSGTPFLIFTDKPKAFADCCNVIPVQHRRHFFYHSNDRKCLLEKALSMFDYCVNIDSDVRILAPFPQDHEWLPGITARSCSSIIKQEKLRVDVKSDRLRKIRLQWLERLRYLSQKLDVNLEDKNVKWVYEFLFVLKKDAGKEIEFLEQFEVIARYFELHGIYRGCGTAMGLAAAKVGLPVRHDLMEGVEFFDDKIEKAKISNGEAEPKAKQEYFDTQYKIEHPQKSLLEKAVLKALRVVTEKARFYYHAVRSRIISLSDYDFYYR
ncbi:hypothetical protein H6F88_13150 [Oculatella sp. FACHB-28]|uniref:hypothetical protein n=1 Tax=Oculatella sp. FACHB-28 TaxID=2692845 RepID=UPI00168A0629|nr:hypothetical protein [Oculatella sp. FACHB-28]MBD2056949.1 hypothetical protein [Oculatella sp. FACHB-28]